MNFPTNPPIDAGIRETLAARPELRIDVFSEYLEEDLFPDADATVAFGSDICRKYRGRRIDLVIAFTGGAVRFALGHRGELFPDAPIVFGTTAPPAEAARRDGAGVALFVWYAVQEPGRIVPLEVPAVRPVLDRRQAQQWQVDSSRLPLHTDIQFRTPTLWEANRQYLVGAAVVIGAELLLIAALLTERTSRRRAEMTILAREASLRTSYERISQLNTRMLTAQESARAAIARELNDDVCQELVGVLLALSSLRRTSSDALGPDVHDTLSQLHDTTSSVVAGVRRMSHDLHPSTLRLVGMTAAVRAHCVELERRHNVQIVFDSHGDLDRLHPDAALCIFRVVQEALRNAAVHGHSRQIGVAIRLSANVVDVTVLDDGRGFDVDSARQTSGGLGLIMMEERVRLLGGTMEIISRPEEGAALIVQIPADGGPDMPAIDFGPRLETIA